MFSFPFSNRRHTPSVRASIASLVIGCVLPIAFVSGVLILDYYRYQYVQLTGNAISRARAMMSVVDHDFSSTQAALQALGTSPFLTSGDLAGFRAQAREALPNMQARNIALLSAAGQLVLTTSRPLGEQLAAESVPVRMKRVLETNRPDVSDLFSGRVAEGPIFSIGVPVLRDGVTVFALSASVAPAQLSRLLSEQRIPDTWRAAVIDGAGSVVARTHDIEKFLGQRVVSDLWQRMGALSEGGFESKTLDGIPVLTVYSRSPVTKWAVVVGIPLEEVTAGLRQTVGLLIVASLAALFVGLMLAWYIGGRIAASIRALIHPARALGAGDTVAIPYLYFKEAKEMGQALLDAATTLREVQYEAHHDILTGLPNRSLFHIFINRQLTLCRRNQWELAILYLDLDGFKTINDTHGHATGDLLLRAVSQRIVSTIRESDIAARFGGDEFAVALLHSSIDNAKVFANKLIDAIAAPYQLGEIEARISVSVGAAGFPTTATDIDTLLKKADRAMYKAKEISKRQACGAIV